MKMPECYIEELNHIVEHIDKYEVKELSFAYRRLIYIELMRQKYKMELNKENYYYLQNTIRVIKSKIIAARLQEKVAEFYASKS